MQHAIPTGCSFLDNLLNGGFPRNRVSLVYGEAETGKTTLAIQCAVNLAKTGYKTIFVDSDGMFSPIRLSQIADCDLEETAPLISLVRPTTFQEQSFTIDRLDEYVFGKVGLVVVDTITSLYSVELGPLSQTIALNRELNRQVAFLAQIAKTHKVAILITSQVRSVFSERNVVVEPVATRVLRFWSDVVIKIKHTGQTRVINVLLEKHPEREPPINCYLRIEKTGIREFSH